MEEAIRRKLCADGDGSGDDRRLIVLMKAFVKWANEDLDAETSQLQLKKVLTCLQQCEQSIQRAALVYTACEKEMHLYDDLSGKIDKQIQDAYEKITQCKAELAEAKQIRKHRQEYDALANVIQQHPDRRDTVTKLADVQQELTEAVQKEKALQGKLELRQKQFHVLMVSLLQLNQILEEEERKDVISTADAETPELMDVAGPVLPPGASLPAGSTTAQDQPTSNNS